MVNLQVYGSMPLLFPSTKKGNKTMTENYRPISLTCSTSKLFEKIISDKIKSYLRDNNLLPDYQYGFLNRRSTTAILLRTLNL